MGPIGKHARPGVPILALLQPWPTAWEWWERQAIAPRTQRPGQEAGPGKWARQRGYRARTCRSAPRGTGRGAASVASWAAARLGGDALAGRPRHLENRAT